MRKSRKRRRELLVRPGAVTAVASAVAFEPVRTAGGLEEERRKLLGRPQGADEELRMVDRLGDVLEARSVKPLPDLLESVPRIDRRREQIEDLVKVDSTPQKPDRAALERERERRQHEPL